MIDRYRGNGKRETAPAEENLVDQRRLPDLTDPEAYRPSQEALDAVNVALLMRMPLLINGEPGSGKTQLGYAVAHELGLSPPRLFVTKSTTQARDLFYRYDALRHFHAAQTGGDANPARFVHLEPLGQAISDALTGMQRVESGLAEAPDRLRQRSLVIIDEIDKAPRDFPNDLLHELEHLRFRIPELDTRETPTIPHDVRPIVFITTNAEQLLPDAFVRRCAFLHLVPPCGEELARLIERRFQGILAADYPLVADVVALSDRLRDRGQLGRPPSSAELLQFLSALIAGGGAPDQPLTGQPISVDAYVPLLAKSASDTARIRLALAD